MDNEARLLLDDAIACCQRDGLDARLINMLASARALTLTEDALTIEAPSRFAYSYLVKQRDVIERYLSEIAFAQLALNVTVPEAPAGTPTSRTEAVPAAAEGAAEATATAGSTAPARHAGPLLADTREAADRKVNVTKTMSEADFRTMMERMKQDGGTGASAGPAAPAPAPAEPAAPSAAEDATEYPSVGVNSKFTFDNFVLGDENRHAYQSAARFAAFADEPGQCTSLFIYGNSGLGKTHLLFAIKNYLAAEKPYIRVKYANSQAYIDDYMRDLGAQRGPGEPIMREYRTADVLIIDDIQNIIGRQASIEFFFQLVDEFIRENKKIVIASDRAPKKLGMDERLTSRFNSGMLCLVSEPSFETKYRILKYYYENMICSATNVPASAGDLSILDGIALEEGKLTDDHLRHMAEISGNNIRELESFCERCAGLSFEKEQAGRELTATDIDAIADEYFDTAHKVVRVETIQSVVEEFYHVSHEDMIGRKRSKNIVFPRHVATYLVNSMCEMSLKAVGAAFGRDHTTVIHSIEKVETKMKEDARFKEEIQQLKNIILIKS
ncbi:DnaA ATPase domain-containing protein [Collinsella tanakaei]|uniref:DnaA ATPase domain-containing protein n=1 Tax=Collinsella tanakaei TaxID=626935 RepID=UPI0025A4873E|nr:DnaA/Hda family protein [Collinsella tanakaei]MDM8299486.1 DnaA/Hda family protein [Collinsella tanakaei]